MGAIHLMPNTHIHRSLELVFLPVNEEGWDKEILKEVFNEQVCSQIHHVLGNIKITEERDMAWWMPCESGKFIVGIA